MLMNASRNSLHRDLRRMEADGAIACHPSTIGIRYAASLRDVTLLT